MPKPKRYLGVTLAAEALGITPGRLHQLRQAAGHDGTPATTLPAPAIIIRDVEREYLGYDEHDLQRCRALRTSAVAPEAPAGNVVQPKVYVGVTGAARLLNLSRGRFNELREDPECPPHEVEIQQPRGVLVGWREPTILGYGQTRNVKPGRPVGWRKVTAQRPSR